MLWTERLVRSRLEISKRLFCRWLHLWQKLKYFISIGNKKPTDIELIEFFHKEYPEAHPMHLAADLHGIQQLMFGYKDFEGNPFEDNR